MHAPTMQAIHNYRETEKSDWNSTNKPIIDRLRQRIFPDGSSKESLDLVHVLDLAADGVIKPHVDAERVC